MDLRNPFPKWIKEIFYRSRYCLKCGRTDTAIELHHITGRENNCALNCCRICKKCHEPANHTQEMELMFFILTMRYLLTQKYQLTEDDKEFLITNPHLLLGYTSLSSTSHQTSE